MNDTVSPPRLLSPTRRRLLDVVWIGADAAKQLVTLGWTAYVGSAQATADLDERATSTLFDALGIPDPAKATNLIHQGTRNGWVIPGTDPRIDAERLRITGTTELGPGRIS